jgi:hypothetical protein
MTPLTYRQVSVVAPVSLAISRARLLLFEPFDLAKWFIVGFCAWLATLGEGGFGGGGGNYSRGYSRGQAGDWLEQAQHWIRDNLWWLVPVVIAVVLLSIALWLLLTWLSSRGQFMFLHCVATNRAEVVAPWHAYEREANSLFLFRIVIGLITIPPSLVLLGGLIFAIVTASRSDGVSAAAIIAAILLGLVLVVFWFLVFVVLKLTKDFVVPMMYLRRQTCRQAWSEFGGLLRANFGNFVLYLLFYMLLSLATAALLLLIIVVTCCIAACLLALPYLGTVLMLPILVFFRAYSLHYLAQYGAESDVFLLRLAPEQARD